MHLGEPVENLDDAIGVDGYGYRGVQGVGCQLVLVHELWSGDGLRDGYQEVVRLKTSTNNHAHTCRGEIEIAIA